MVKRGRSRASCLIWATKLNGPLTETKQNKSERQNASATAQWAAACVMNKNLKLCWVGIHVALGTLQPVGLHIQRGYVSWTSDVLKAPK